MLTYEQLEQLGHRAMTPQLEDYRTDLRLSVDDFGMTFGVDGVVVVALTNAAFSEGEAIAYQDELLSIRRKGGHGQALMAVDASGEIKRAYRYLGGQWFKLSRGGRPTGAEVEEEIAARLTASHLPLFGENSAPLEQSDFGFVQLVANGAVNVEMPSENFEYFAPRQPIVVDTLVGGVLRNGPLLHIWPNRIRNLRLAQEFGGDTLLPNVITLYYDQGIWWRPAYSSTGTTKTTWNMVFG